MVSWLIFYMNMNFIVLFRQGQFDQGAYVMKLMNFTKKNGFFIEAGAYDGVVASNTLLMEVMYDWTGIKSASGLCSVILMATVETRRFYQLLE